MTHFKARNLTALLLVLILLVSMFSTTALAADCLLYTSDAADE